VRIDVLGTLAVASKAGVVSGSRLGGRRAQVVLVALALERRAVPSERLAAVVWAGDPPVTWPAALRGVVRELRTALEPIGGGGQRVIATESPGYRLAAGVRVDVAAAAQAIREAASLVH
jgi:DNA-binding SARP family transcriptional activator